MKQNERDEILKTYQDLLIVQYNSQPKARNIIKGIGEIILQNGIFQQIENAFDLKTAIGVQLDTLGEWIGVDRGYSKGMLNDTDYRTLLYFKIIQNNSNHTQYSINESLYIFFGTKITNETNGNMSTVYFIDSATHSVINAVYEKNALPLASGVLVNYAIVSDYPLFCLVSAFATIESPSQAGFANAFDLVNVDTDDNVGRLINIDDFRYL